MLRGLLATPTQGVPVLGFPSHRWSVGVLGDWGEVQEGFCGQLGCWVTWGRCRKVPVVSWGAWLLGVAARRIRWSVGVLGYSGEVQKILWSVGVMGYSGDV